LTYHFLDCGRPRKRCQHTDNVGEMN
jgi:hypothetical protein